MNIWQAVVLGVVEGVTEFLPVSSTGHLTITEKLLGLRVDDPGVTAFTAVIQIGAIAAVVLYFAQDIWRMTQALYGGLIRPERRDEFDFRFGVSVLLGSLPICLVGFLGKDLITGPLRSLWFVAGALVLWSAVMVYSEYVGRQDRGEEEVTIADGVIIGMTQSLALIPGISRSGATISAGLLRGLDRVTATRMSFFLGIPALVGAGIFEMKDAVGSQTVGIGALIVGTLVSFIVAYASIAWLLRFVAHHSMTWFAGYRVMLGGVLVIALASEMLAAT